MSKKQVVVTTEYRGVFYGTLEKEDGNVVVLSNARLCVYWSEDVKGFLGLAANGPTSNCRISPVAAPELKLHRVTSISTCSATAVKAWEGSPWQ